MNNRVCNELPVAFYSCDYAARLANSPSERRRGKALPTGGTQTGAQKLRVKRAGVSRRKIHSSLRPCPHVPGYFLKNVDLFGLSSKPEHFGKLLLRFSENSLLRATLSPKTTSHKNGRINQNTLVLTFLSGCFTCVRTNVHPNSHYAVD